jgi:hypothetical protein
MIKCQMYGRVGFTSSVNAYCSRGGTIRHHRSTTEPLKGQCCVGSPGVWLEHAAARGLAGQMASVSWSKACRSRWRPGTSMASS